MTAGNRQVLAHGPLGRVVNSTSLNVTMGRSDCWASREGACGPWGAVTGIPRKARVLCIPLCVIGRQKSVKGNIASP